MKKVIASTLFIIPAVMWGTVIFAQTTANDWFDAAKKLFNEKKYAQAASAYDKAAELNPSNHIAFYQAGWCYNDLEIYVKAVDRLKKAIALKPDYHLAYQELGFAYKSLGRNEEALISLNKAVELSPSYALAYKQLGDVYKNLLKYDEAITAYKKCYQYDSSNSSACYNLGYVYNTIEDYPNAIEWLQKSLSLKKEGSTYNELGFAYYKLKRNDEALAAYINTIVLEPNNGTAYKGIGDTYRINFKPAKISEAIESYKKALEYNPRSSGSNYGLGWCYNETSKYAEAIPVLRKAIELEKSLVIAYVELGYALYMTEKYEEGLSVLRQGMELNNKNAFCRYYSGLIYIKQKDKDKATAMYNELLPLDSKLAEKLLIKINAL